MNKPNPFVGVNYINDNTRMAIPPAYWLQRLYDFDDKLVVFPSRHVPYAYVLARRRYLRAVAFDKILENTITQPDTKFCLQQGLAPVTMIFRYSQMSWSIDNIIRSLKARDIWTHGGGDAYADKLDASERAERAADHAKMRDDMWMRSGQAWESYKRRTGQRVSSPGVATQRAPLPTKPSGSTGGSGIVITG
jgi:hypothetical protein